MVLTQMVGKPRPFLRGLLLTIFTFGIYGIYWQFKAHDELHKQFELDKDGRDEGIVWLILGLVLFPLQFVYAWIFVGNVQYLRQRLQLPQGITPGKFIGIEIAAYAAFVVGYIALFAATFDLSETATDEEIAAAFFNVFGVMVVAGIVYLCVLAYAFYRLQSDINGVWTAYEQRMRELTAPAAAPVTAAGYAQAPSYTYWGDLAPPQASLSAPHVRMRVDALQRQHPNLALPPELPDLLARGEAGDASAVQAAAALLDGVDRLAQERAKLRRELEDLDAKQARLAGRLANGEVDGAAYATARADLDRQRERAEARLREVEAGLARQ